LKLKDKVVYVWDIADIVITKKKQIVKKNQKTGGAYCYLKKFSKFTVHQDRHVNIIDIIFFSMLSNIALYMRWDTW